MPPGSDDPAAPSGKKGDSKMDKKVEKKSEKSYLASAVESISPWAIGRSTTPTSKDSSSTPPSKPKSAPSSSSPAQKADDHATNTLYGQSFKRYPADCPPMNVMWFHAVDVPKRKPQYLKPKKKDPEPAKLAPPKKFAAFSTVDSRSLENAYQKLLEEMEIDREKGLGDLQTRLRSSSHRSQGVPAEDTPNTALDEDMENTPSGLRIPVNEDFLFDVEIEKRELAPVYWLGPIYEVRRGTWFYQEGSSLRPCEENLAAQLEEGYLKTKPWAYPAIRARSNSGTQKVTPKSSSDNLKATAKSQTGVPSKLKPSPLEPIAPHQPSTYRLFGTYMNSVATYQDSSTAWLSADGVLNWVTSTVYQRFAGGGYMNGIKLVRGYSETGKAKESKPPTTPTTAMLPPQPTSDGIQEKEEKALKRRSAPPATRLDATDSERDQDEAHVVEEERRESQLKRQLSSYIEGSNESAEEQIRLREEQAIQDDYTGQDGETQGREIEHLVLVTHGIGQLLSLRMESINFVHDVNLLRKRLKGVYAHSEDLKALNFDKGDGPGNCKIQVLPVCWRHLLDFPKRRERKGETDLGDMNEDEDEYPSLEDITIEGMAFARSLISDLALDVLLFHSAYKEQITQIVLNESNRIYKLFMERNPEFKGKVHVIGHSLGAAVMFDILCRQKQQVERVKPLRNPLQLWPSREQSDQPRKSPKDLSFDFDVEDLYCLGSPVGLFQMLKGRTIAARHQSNAVPSDSPLDIEDPFLSSSAAPGEHVSAITGLPLFVSSPKVAQLFNVFHPSDPIAYRLEPLVSPAMSSLKPQALPYTKKGIFGAVAPQGLSGIGVKVGQSVSGLWSSFSAGIASSLLNRSLGLTNDDIARLNAANANSSLPNNPSQTQAASANSQDTTNSDAVVTNPTAQSHKNEARKKALALNSTADPDASGESINNRQDSTLIDDDLETLYTRFQKKRVEEHKGSLSRDEEGIDLGEAWAAEELKAQKLRREELKVRALNLNGRIDYCIQESALDFNPINIIASHMCYWQDEDVSHFLCSQILCDRDARAKKYQFRHNTPML
ncbi:DDHD domain-containing protein [Astrocystis sublimbata]|nr:DDHD domain-containing protein [Astrocystis sublimbata]